MTNPLPLSGRTNDARRRVLEWLAIYTQYHGDDEVLGVSYQDAPITAGDLVTLTRSAAVEAIPPAPEAPVRERVPLPVLEALRWVANYECATRSPTTYQRWWDLLVAIDQATGRMPLAGLAKAPPTTPAPTEPCFDGGPRIGEDRCYCWLPKGHEGQHEAHESFQGRQSSPPRWSDIRPGEWSGPGVPAPAPTEPEDWACCPRCGGSGTVEKMAGPWPCDDCDGEGAVRAPEPTPDPPAETFKPNESAYKRASNQKVANPPDPPAETAGEGLVERVTSIIESAESDTPWTQTTMTWGERSAVAVLSYLGWPGGNEVAVWLTPEQWSNVRLLTFAFGSEVDDLHTAIAAALRTHGEPEA